MSRKHPMDVAPLGADFHPAHAPAAVRALGDVDEEDLLEQPRIVYMTEPSER